MTPHRPGVSVVIPSARGGAYLREAVGSVLGQSFQDFELIIVADGCPDDLVDLEALDGRIRVIRQERRGVSIARNVGIQAARSELIAFLDDDDRMLPARLAAQFDAMAHREEVGLCHTQFRVIDGAGSPLDVGFARDVQYLDLLRREVRIRFPTTMMRKSLVEEVGGFDGCLVTGEDLDLIYRMARESTLCYLPDVLIEYRRHGANASGDEYRAACDSLMILEKHLRCADLLGEVEAGTAARLGLQAARRGGARGAISTGRSAWRRRDLRAALQELRAAFSMSRSYTLADVVGNRRPVAVIRSLLRGFEPKGRT